MASQNDLDRFRDDFAPPPFRAGINDNVVREEGFPHEVAPTAPPPPTGCRTCLTGCGCAGAVFLVLVISAGVLIAYSWRSIAASVCRRIATGAIAAAPLPEADRRRIVERLERVADDFAASRVTVTQLGRMIKELTEGWVLPLAVTTAVDMKYVQPSGFGPDEKRAARRTLDRLARAIVEGTMRVRDTEPLLTPILEGDDDSDLTLKEQLTDAELRTFLAGVKRKVDDLGVPDEPFAVNVADEVDEAINRAMNPQAEGPPAARDRR